MITVAKRLLSGQDLKQELEELAKSQEIHAGIVLSGVGSLQRAKLRLPVIGGDVKYLELKDLEIDSLHGTVSNSGNHIHITVSDIDGKVWGGHLADGCIVRTTCEIIIGIIEDKKFLRELDKDTGFKELEIH